MRINKKAPFYETREVKDLKDMLNSSCELFGDNVAFLQKDKPGGVYQEIKFNEYKKPPIPSEFKVWIIVF